MRAKDITGFIIPHPIRSHGLKSSKFDAKIYFFFIVSWISQESLTNAEVVIHKVL